MYETDRAITVTVELAGVYDAAEIRRGPFHLEVRLSAAVESHRAETRYERGLLSLILPKVVTLVAEPRGCLASPTHYWCVVPRAAG